MPRCHPGACLRRRPGSPGSIVPLAPASDDSWIPGTSRYDNLLSASPLRPERGISPPCPEECMHTVFDFAAKRAQLAPDAIAFEEAEGGRRITFAAFNERTERGAAGLGEISISAGEPGGIPRP